jgi:hypothetical protein
MARKTKRAKLQLTNELRLKLTRLSQSRKASLREIQRAKILLYYADETPIKGVAKIS